ncbi:MAG: 4-phosphopantoate--beta-alanine ligase, partial [Bacteroidota bacterium]
EVEGVSTILEGRFRPAHFRGVTTVVAKLLNITKPHVAVFGQKDAQQVFIIRKMASELNLDVTVLVAPIVREDDGLAMSSRNAYLNETERARVTVLFKSLQMAQKRIEEGERSAVALKGEIERMIMAAEPTQLDYIAFVQPDLFKEIQHVEPPSVLVALAVRFGSTRLIDNMIVGVAS